MEQLDVKIRKLAEVLADREFHLLYEKFPYNDLYEVEDGQIVLKPQYRSVYWEIVEEIEQILKSKL